MHVLHLEYIVGRQLHIILLFVIAYELHKLLIFPNDGVSTHLSYCGLCLLPV